MQLGCYKGGQEEKWVYEICQTLSNLSHLLFRPVSHNWSMTLYPVSSFIVFCANTASWPKRGSADHMHQVHGVLERDHSTVLELDMCLWTGLHLEKSPARSHNLLLQHFTPSPSTLFFDRIYSCSPTYKRVPRSVTQQVSALRGEGRKKTVLF